MFSYSTRRVIGLLLGSVVLSGFLVVLLTLVHRNQPVLEQRSAVCSALRSITVETAQWAISKRPLLIVDNEVYGRIPTNFSLSACGEARLGTRPVRIIRPEAALSKWGDSAVAGALLVDGIDGRGYMP